MSAFRQANRPSSCTFFLIACIIGFALFPLSAQTAPAASGSAASADTATANLEDALFAGSGATSSATPSPAASPPVTVLPGISSPDVARTEYLAGGTVVVQALSTIGSEAKSILDSSNAAGKLFAKVSVPDYGDLFVSYNASLPFFQGYSGSGTPPPALDPLNPAYSLSELHYSFDIAKKVFIRIGDQLIAWGPSQVWTPVDFINRQKADSFASVDLRNGKSGLRVHVPLNGANLFAFADFSGMTASGLYGDPVKTVNLGGRYDFTANGFEFGFTGYGGEHSRAQFGADFSGWLFAATVYGELAFAPEYSSRSAVTQASLGFSRTLDELKLWTLSGEGFWNSAGHDFSGYSAVTINLLPSAETVPLYQGSWYAYAALTASELFSPSLATTLSAISNLQDRSYSVKLAESFTFPRAVPCTFSVAYQGGGVDREFTRYSGDGSVSLSLLTRIDF
jgi:hypothetical protein